MKQQNIGLFAVEMLLVPIPLFSIASCFPSGGVLIQNGSLTFLWAIPLGFIFAAATLQMFADQGVKIPSWLLFVFSRLSRGAYLGLSLGAILILNKWYADPSISTCEPLFTATGLSGAGVLIAERWVEKTRKKEWPSEEKAVPEGAPLDTKSNNRRGQSLTRDKSKKRGSNKTEAPA